MSKSKRKDPKLTLRKKADKLLQEYIKKKYDMCLICESPINCGHHFFTKASSNALRYYLPDIIPICKACHCKVHTQPHLVVPKICFIMGQDWYDDLIEVKRAGIKETIEWYELNITNLENEIDKLSVEKG
jgi:hypothetical protein